MRLLMLFLVPVISFFSYSNENYDYYHEIQNFFDNQSLCIGPLEWPVIIMAGQDDWINTQMVPLVDAKLAIFKIENNKKIWSLSNKGKKEFIINKGFCYGPLIIKKIENVDVKSNGLIIVTFKYTINNIPDWAINKSILFANSELNNLISGINSVTYKASFRLNSREVIIMHSEPEQLDLNY